jgi:hypothetical protein
MTRVTGFGWAAGVLIACSASSAGATAAQAERLALTIGPGAEAARLAPQNGGYRLTLPLTLRAETSADGEGHRITAARLLVKDEGQEAQPADARVPVGANSWIASDTFSFDAADHGPLAQNARAACAGAPLTSGARRASMLVPVVWHVTTGRFVRLAAGGLQPDAAMLADAGFYGDQEEQQIEAAIAVTIDCRADGVDRVAETKPDSVQATVAPAPKTKAKPRIVESAMPKAPPPPAEPSDSGETVVAAAAAFTCDGGMVRETLAGPGREVCLCPGHTSRRQTGERSFACEKRFARRR